ncbi:uncharacterized protein M421DRAFT_424030 [Didymella exigua CBS 183.55]|uniref:Uncharacterized protein n=1 Tax=Didymella exigua CBS 183.55 TaxID=1150837 RepID=A0A6A5RD49_9PLEO|nr:uncharacterized protein M421DRAFT_424030 [Didymella exigua CBS 183.55]KAF1925230.1 hypothetical protein M421DRAFT_424030 [Didymella exigua CBS 183.55]
MRSTLILLPLMALLSSVLGAPAPNKCGYNPDKPDWKPKWKDGKPDITTSAPVNPKINERAVPDPKEEVELEVRIDC